MNKSSFNLYLSAFFGSLLLGVLIWGAILSKQNQKPETARTQLLVPVPGESLSRAPKATTTLEQANQISPALLFLPLDKALERVTKKPFGIKISPQNSPVSPERFSGYHTGVDFETFPDEQDVDVSVYAVCEGGLLEKRFASGYGGVAVQSCRLDGQNITVIYGHLNLRSISAKPGDKLVQGSRLGFLGKGFSSETDGERKHLHLGIHKGKNIVLAGYVKTASGLGDWLDIQKYLKQKKIPGRGFFFVAGIYLNQRTSSKITAKNNQERTNPLNCQIQVSVSPLNLYWSGQKGFMPHLDLWVKRSTKICEK